MMDERKLTAVLHVHTAEVQESHDLLHRIKRQAAKPQRQAWWRRWIKRKGVQIAAAALLVLPLAGFAAKQIWVVSPKPPGQTVQHARTKDVAIQDLSSAVGFPVKLPAYLPAGTSLTHSWLAGDSTKADAQLRVVNMAVIKVGVYGVHLQMWKAETAAPFPPGDSQGEVMGSEPWHKTLTNTPVKVGENQGSLLIYLLSGMQTSRVYWHENGINYAVVADGHVPVAELLKVAHSLK